MIDLTNYSERELSLVVLNDEYYYNLLLQDEKAALLTINDDFIFTEDQYSDLLDSLVGGIK